MKKKPTKKSAASNREKIVMKMIRNEHLRLQDEISERDIKIQNLQHQIVGFRAVISYLEDLSGIRNSQ